MKIEKFFNKKERKEQYRSRFQLNNKEFTPTADTHAELLELIDEIRVQERRAKRNLPVAETPGPTLAELFAKILPTIRKHHQRKVCERVFKAFTELLPAGMRVKELKKSHYQIYIDWRTAQTGKITKKPILRETVYKELYAISHALGNGELYWDALENWKKPSLPKNPEKKRSRQESRRKRIVSRDGELGRLLAELRKPRTGKQTEYTERHRKRLADELEFRYETGLRRKEVALLEPKQYFPQEEALRNVVRWKTDTVTKFFPLTQRARQIVETRLAAGGNAKYIFTEDGNPVASDYRTLKKVCKSLGIAYGRFAEDGFVPHDLRHNFASEVIGHTDIETARELLGHSNIGQTGDYLHTDEKRMREAIRRRDGVDLKREVTTLYVGVKRGKIKLRELIEKVKKLTDI